MAEPSTPAQPQRQRVVPRQVAWTAIGVLMALLVAGLGWIVFGRGALWILQHIDGIKDPSAMASKDLADAINDIRGQALSVGTGLLAAIAIYYTATNARSARQSAQAAHDGVREAAVAQRRTYELTEHGQQRTHELTERGQLTDRFTAAVAQLGSDSPAIQLGGVHALAGLADDATDRTFRQTCIDVLCAYLRLPYDPDPGEDPEQADAQKRFRAIREVRHTVIRVIGNRLRVPDDDRRSWQGHDFDFTDVIFDGGVMHGAAFSGGIVTFRSATFSGGWVDFKGATFSGGTVDFNGATFSGGSVNFDGAKLSGGRITFEYATLSGGMIAFRDATLSGGTVSFAGAKLSGGTVDFGRAMLSNGALSFLGATFSGGRVVFLGATFSGGIVAFGRSTFSGGTIDFSSARFSGGKIALHGTNIGRGTVDFGHTKFSDGRVTFNHRYGERPQPWPSAWDAAGISLPLEWLADGLIADEEPQSAPPREIS